MQKVSAHLLVTAFSLLISMTALVIVLSMAFNLPWLPEPQVAEPAKLTLLITTTPGPTARPEKEVMSTAVAVAFDMFVQTQEAGQTPTPLQTPTSVFFISTGIASQTQSSGSVRTTTDLAVDVSRLSRFRFRVPQDSTLYLRDTSGDGRSNACTISKGGFKISVTMPASGAPSAPFRLPAGNYKLKCTGSNKSARITSS